MDVALISTLPTTSINTSTAAQPATGSRGFSMAMAAENGGDRTTLEQAEALVGTRIRAPEGGCGCDAFVNTVAPQTPAPETAGPQAAAPETIAARAASPTATASTRSAAIPGQVVSIAEASANATDLGEHLHRAIIRNATEMIMANTDGLVEVLAIPWDRATLSTSSLSNSTR